MFNKMILIMPREVGQGTGMLAVPTCWRVVKQLDILDALISVVASNHDPFTARPNRMEEAKVM